MEPVWAVLDEGYQDSLAEASTLERTLARQWLGDHLDGDTLTRLGVASNPRFVAYALGWAPVIRIGLREPERVAAIVAALPTLAAPGSDARVGTANFHGQHYSYRLSDSGDIMLAAVVGSDLVLAYIPACDLQRELLGLAFGQRLPDQTGGMAGFEALRTANGLGPNLFGSFSLRRLAEAADTPSSLTARMKTPSTVSKPDNPCAADYTKLTELAPGTIFGFRELSNRRVSAVLIWELDPAIGAALMDVAAPIPGVAAGEELEGIVSGGLGIVLAELPAAAERISRRIDDLQLRCDDTISVVTLLAETAATVAAVPPGALELTGIGGTIYDYPDDDGPESKQRHTLDVVGVVGVRDREALIREVLPLAQGINMDLLEQLGKPIPVAALTTEPLPEEYRAAAVVSTEHALGVATGGRSRKALTTAVERLRPSEDRGRQTLMLVTLDSQALAQRERAREKKGKQPDALLQLLRRAKRYDFQIQVGNTSLEFELTTTFR